MKRVLHVVSTLDAGGTETHALALMKTFAPQFEQRVLALGRSSGMLEAAFAQLAPLKVIARDDTRGMRFLARVVGEVAAEATRFGPDAVLLHFFGLHHVACALGARFAGVGQIVASAGNTPPVDLSGRRGWARVVQVSSIVRCPIVACSGAVYDGLVGLGRTLPERSCTIPYGTSFAGVRRTIATAPGKAVVGMVARLDPIKNHAALIEAFGAVWASRPEAELWLVGDGELRPALEALARSKPYSHAIKFLGRRSDVPALLGQMDVFAFSTTEAEGFGIALIEAMAAGVPIVASDVGACREVLDKGRCGLLAAPGDAQSLGRQIVRLLEDAQLAQAISSAASDHVASEYAIASTAGRWVELLRLA